LDDFTKFVLKVIDSCKTFEQLMITERWLTIICPDEEFIFFARKAIYRKEVEIGSSSVGGAVDICTTERH